MCRGPGHIFTWPAGQVCGERGTRSGRSRRGLSRSRARARGLPRENYFSPPRPRQTPEDKSTGGEKSPIQLDGKDVARISPPPPPVKISPRGGEIAREYLGIFVSFTTHACKLIFPAFFIILPNNVVCSAFISLSLSLFPHGLIE